jgi:hypothetical protein
MSALDDLAPDGIVDTRAVDERIDELEANDEPTDDERDELAELLAFRDAVDCPDWQYGETLIREDAFEDYARELAEEIGVVPRDAPWPTSFIDWPAAADALLMDYTSAEDANGTTWYYR